MPDAPTELSSLFSGFMEENDRMEKNLSVLNEKLNKLCPPPQAQKTHQTDAKERTDSIPRDKTFIDSLREEINRKARLGERLSESINHLSQII